MPKHTVHLPPELAAALKEFLATAWETTAPKDDEPPPPPEDPFVYVLTPSGQVVRIHRRDWNQPD
jgi:hypothetical protein